jgi:hypothetical protein
VAVNKVAEGLWVSGKRFKDLLVFLNQQTMVILAHPYF